MPQRNRRGDDPDLQPIINASLNAFFRLNPTAQLLVMGVLLAGGIAFFLYLHFHHQTFGPDGTASANMVLGNPSNATADSSNRENYLMVKPYYVLSYNDTKGTPNWVSWRVTQADLGTAPRKDSFDEDTELPNDFYRVAQHDYIGAGFDRGHMCPHSDRAANEQMSYATFIMTNIIPQAPNVNRKAWAQLEDYCRELVRHHDRLYVLAGPVGQGGRGSNGPASTIAHERVVVPSACWKVVIDVPDEGLDDPATIGSDARVLAVEMPNDNNIVGEEWAQYRTTPARIEQETGLHFFTRLRPEVAATLRTRQDQTPLPPPRDLGHGHAE